MIFVSFLLLKSNDEHTWSIKVENIPKYDNNGKKYLYTIKEDTTLDRYQKVEYKKRIRLKKKLKKR